MNKYAHRDRIMTLKEKDQSRLCFKEYWIRLEHFELHRGDTDFYDCLTSRLPTADEWADNVMTPEGTSPRYLRFQITDSFLDE